VLITILQSRARGVGAWGERGMEKLWSAANRRIYGGGDDTILGRLVKIIGDRELLHSSTSASKQGTSVNRSLHREQILAVDELAVLPVVPCDPTSVRSHGRQNFR
jgi:hypothetical protein